METIKFIFSFKLESYTFGRLTYVLKINILKTDSRLLNFNTNDKLYSPDNNFYFMLDTYFNINPYNCTLPKNIDPMKKDYYYSKTLYFYSDIERKKFLLLLKNQLINLSKSTILKNESNTNERVDFVDDKWYVY